MKKILFAVLLLLCSCDLELSTADGVVTAVVKESDYSNEYKYRVKVKKARSMAQINGGNTYWFLTNDTLNVGDSIHIGKINKEGRLQWEQRLSNNQFQK